MFRFEDELFCYKFICDVNDKTDTFVDFYKFVLEGIVVLLVRAVNKTVIIIIIFISPYHPLLDLSPP